MSTLSIEELIQKWATEEITDAQAIGQLIIRVSALQAKIEEMEEKDIWLSRRVQELENKSYHGR